MKNKISFQGSGWVSPWENIRRAGVFRGEFTGRNFPRADFSEGDFDRRDFFLSWGGYFREEGSFLGGNFTREVSGYAFS